MRVSSRLSPVFRRLVRGGVAVVVPDGLTGVDDEERVEGNGRGGDEGEERDGDGGEDSDHGGGEDSGGRAR